MVARRRPALGKSGERSETIKGGEARPLRARHDGFSPSRQRKFFKTLAKTGCVRDACRRAGISTTTAYRAKERLPELSERWETALLMASTELEPIAWKRAVQGAPETVIRDGKVVATKVKPSDAMLRLLMQGANPGKYGRTGKGQLGEAEMKKLKEKVRQEVLAEIYDPEAIAETRQRILAKFDGIRRRELRNGYVEIWPGGPLVPEGWRPPEGWSEEEFRKRTGG